MSISEKKLIKELTQVIKDSTETVYNLDEDLNEIGSDHIEPETAAEMVVNFLKEKGYVTITREGD